MKPIMEDTLPVSGDPSLLALSDIPRQRLRALVARQGLQFLNSPSAEATLRAVCHGFDREAPLLIAALRAEIPARILAAPSMPVSILSDDLAEQMKIVPEAAAWAVESWASAMGGMAGTLTALRQSVLPAVNASGMASGMASIGYTTLSRGEMIPQASAPIIMKEIIPPPKLEISVWPPRSGAQETPVENTSGTDGPLPSAVAAKKWNWGACALSWLWLIFHKKPFLGIITLLVNFVPIAGGLVGLVAALYFGANGYEIAWRSRRFESVEEFFAVQDRWSLWGTIVTVAATVVIVGGAAWWIQSHQAMLLPSGI